MAPSHDGHSEADAAFRGHLIFAERTSPMKYRKKLVKVALPLDAINKVAAWEKSTRHGQLCPLRNRQPLMESPPAGRGSPAT